MKKLMHTTNKLITILNAIVKRPEFINCPMNIWVSELDDSLNNADNEGVVTPESIKSIIDNLKMEIDLPDFEVVIILDDLYLEGVRFSSKEDEFNTNYISFDYTDDLEDDFNILSHLCGDMFFDIKRLEDALDFLKLFIDHYRTNLKQYNILSDFFYNSIKFYEMEEFDKKNLINELLNYQNKGLDYLNNCKNNL